ncbi:MAG TPA: hypothetical protein VMV08_11430, partial [Gaiellaceae bacterium]|nr:hypothetical protein [Gaiellaceae bacterium]
FVLVELLRAEGARAGVRPGENGYTYGVLVGLELARLSGSDAAIDRAVRRTSRGTGRAFLT